MNRKEYEKTNDYQESLKILREFIGEMLNGDIERLRMLDFSDLAKYISNSIDPDMYLITQAIYIILWGDIYDLTFDKMGSWSLDGEHPFRGDTMNSFNSVFGKKKKMESLLIAQSFSGQTKMKNYGRKL